MNGHGHVTPNADGSKARCGGPGVCPECSHEKATKANTLTRAHQLLRKAAGTALLQCLARRAGGRMLKEETVIRELQIAIQAFDEAKETA